VIQSVRRDPSADNSEQTERWRTLTRHRGGGGGVVGPRVTYERAFNNNPLGRVDSIDAQMPQSLLLHATVADDDDDDDDDDDVPHRQQHYQR